MQYLGLNKEKKKILKPSEKFKNIFNFEWDATEDTSINFNPIFSREVKPAELKEMDHWSKKTTS